jgi:hypothetical protein
MQGRHNMTKEQMTTHSTLLLAAKQGEGRAFECLMSRYQAGIFAVALKSDAETLPTGIPDKGVCSHGSFEKKKVEPSTRRFLQFLAALYIHTLMVGILVVFSRNLFSTAIRTVLLALLR